MGTSVSSRNCWTRPDNALPAILHFPGNTSLQQGTPPWTLFILQSSDTINSATTVTDTDLNAKSGIAKPGKPPSNPVEKHLRQKKKESNQHNYLKYELNFHAGVGRFRISIKKIRCKWIKVRKTHKGCNIS